MYFYKVTKLKDYQKYENLKTVTELKDCVWKCFKYITKYFHLQKLLRIVFILLYLPLMGKFTAISVKFATWGHHLKLRYSKFVPILHQVRLEV